MSRDKRVIYGYSETNDIAKSIELYRHLKLACGMGKHTNEAHVEWHMNENAKDRMHMSSYNTYSFFIVLEAGKMQSSLT